MTGLLLVLADAGPESGVWGRARGQDIRERSPLKINAFLYHHNLKSVFFAEQKIVERLWA